MADTNTIHTIPEFKNALKVSVNTEHSFFGKLSAAVELNTAHQGHRLVNQMKETIKKGSDTEANKEAAERMELCSQKFADVLDMGNTLSKSMK